jgi:hypothetical protein
VVVLSEVIAQQTHRAEVQLTPLEHPEDHGETTRNARGGDAMVRFALTEAELPLAEVEHRAVAVLQV